MLLYSPLIFEEGVQILREEGCLCDFVLSAFFFIILSYYADVLFFGPLIEIKFSLEPVLELTDFVVCFKVIDVIQIVF